MLQNTNGQLIISSFLLLNNKVAQDKIEFVIIENHDFIVSEFV